VNSAAYALIDFRASDHSEAHIQCARRQGGWIFFERIYAGPTEEIPFRALLVTYLATSMPGKLQIGRFNMNWAGIIVALIFALLHANNFDTRHWPEALGQQFYVFALGVLYA
jgi:membrane protease YdiL (CAAX protease family)